MLLGPGRRINRAIDLCLLGWSWLVSVVSESISDRHRREVRAVEVRFQLLKVHGSLSRFTSGFAVSIDDDGLAIEGHDPGVGDREVPATRVVSATLVASSSVVSNWLGAEPG
jgi:hypothetical protein